MLAKKEDTGALQLFEASSNKIVNERISILQYPEVKGKLTSIEGLITEATTKPVVKELPEQHILDQINILVPMICKDLGIVKWNENPQKAQYTKTRFFQAVTRYYSGLSISSLKLAFDMLAIGQLDDYLQKDRNQQPDRNHYGEFSFEFYARILNAYVKKTADVWGKVRLSLPKVETSISQEERNRNHNAIINEIYVAFDNYKANKVDPNFDLEIYLNTLIEYGLTEKVKPKPETVDKAYKILLVDPYLSKLDKTKMKTDYHNEKRTHKLQMEAQRMENNHTVKILFDKIIKQKKDIRDLLKNI